MKRMIPTISAVVIAMLTGLISVANGGILCYNTVKGKHKACTKIKQYIRAILCTAYAVILLLGIIKGENHGEYSYCR